MATNHIQPGHTLKLTAPTGGVTSGSFYLIGSLIVLANVTAAAAALFEASISGVKSVTKAGSQAWTEGLKIYWDDTAKVFTSSSASGANSFAGYAVEAVGAGAGATTGKLLLNGLPSCCE
jgi:predicted RecA/RadA family phage recombinase